MNLSGMPHMMKSEKDGNVHDYTLKVYEHMPTGSSFMIDRKNYVGSFESMLKYSHDLMHRVSNIPSHVIAYNQDTGEEHQVHDDGTYKITKNRYDEGGEVEEGENKEMLQNQVVNLAHHIKELQEVVAKTDEVEAWVITKIQRAVTDLADVTHYLDGEAQEMAKGGMIKMIPKGEEYRFLGSNGIERDIIDKIRSQLQSLKFAGNFEIRYKEKGGTRVTDGYLYELDDFDKISLVTSTSVKLKPEEKVFRYYTRTTAIGGMMPLIKINIEKGLAYFPIWDEEKDSLMGFERKSTPLTYLNLTESASAYEKKEKSNLAEAEEAAAQLSKTYGLIFLLQRQAGGSKGEYINANEEDYLDEMNGIYKSKLVKIYANGKSYADGGMMAMRGKFEWQNAKIGDSALVISENKLGVIVKDYGRKFHLKFPDGTEKTYDASELKFIIDDEDDYAEGGMMKKGGITGDVHSLTDDMLSTKIQIFLEKVKPIKYYYIDDTSNTLTVGFDENYTQDAADKFYKAATSSVEFFDADSVDMEYDSKTNDTKYTIKLKRDVKFASGGYVKSKAASGEWVVYDPTTDELLGVYKSNLAAKKAMDKFFESGKYAEISMEVKSDYDRWHQSMAKGGESSNVWVIYTKDWGKKPQIVDEFTATHTTAKRKLKNYQEAKPNSDIVYMMTDKVNFYDMYEDNMAMGGEMAASGMFVGKRKYKTYRPEEWNYDNILKVLDDNFGWDESMGKFINRDDLYDVIYKYGEGNNTESYIKVKAILEKNGWEVILPKDKMAMGGTTFEDKVQSIKRSLLERKKVSPAVQKDYGKTYSPKEAEESARRIAGAQRAKYELKSITGRGRKKKTKA